MTARTALAHDSRTSAQDIMHGDLTGVGPRVSQPAPVVERNWMNKIVQKLRSAEVPLIHKMAIVLIGALAILALGLAVGHPVLIFAALGLPLLYWGKVENDFLNYEETTQLAQAKAFFSRLTTWQLPS